MHRVTYNVHRVTCSMHRVMCSMHVDRGTEYLLDWDQPIATRTGVVSSGREFCCLVVGNFKLDPVRLLVMLQV